MAGHSAGLDVGAKGNHPASTENRVRTPSYSQVTVLRAQLSSNKATELYRIEVYSLTHSWSWALLEKLPTVQPFKKFPAFYRTRRFITMFTRALHWSLSWARSIQSILSHPISLRSILILSTHLRLGLPSGLLPYAFFGPVPGLSAFMQGVLGARSSEESDRREKLPFISI
jgi:hypothetical protein